MLADEVPDDPPGEVSQIIDFGLERRVWEFLEDVDEVFEPFPHGVLGGDPLAIHELVHGLGERGVAEHADVDAEDLAGFFAELGPGAVAQQIQLGDGCAERLPEPLVLLRHLLGAHGAPGNAPVLVVKDEHAPDDNPGRNGDALECFHR